MRALAMMMMSAGGRYRLALPAAALLALGLFAGCAPAPAVRVTPPVVDLAPVPTLTATSLPTAEPTLPPPTATAPGALDTAAPAATQAAAAASPTLPPTPSDPTPTPSRAITMTLFNYRFKPAEVRVQAGETVRLVLENTDHLIHALTIPDAGFASAVGPGNTLEADLYVDLPPGEYYFYCPIQEEGNHEEVGMVGTLIVEARP